MSDVDPQALAQLRAMLAGVSGLQDRRTAALRARPTEGTLAAEDLALHVDGRLVTIYAGQALAGAIDDLNTWRLLANGPELPIRAHLILLRAALEASVRARWHVDPSVDAGTRVGRGIAARRADQRERGLFEASFPDGGARLRATMGPKGKSAAQRLAAIDDPEAVRARDAAGVRPVGFSDTTTLMARYGLEPAFRLTSGLAHGKEWALVATELRRESDHGQAPGVGAGVFSMSEPMAVALTTVTLAAVTRAVVDLERYRLGQAPAD